MRDVGYSVGDVLGALEGLPLIQEKVMGFPYFAGQLPFRVRYVVPNSTVIVTKNTVIEFEDVGR